MAATSEAMSFGRAAGLGTAVAAASSGLWATGEFVGRVACPDATSIAAAGSNADAFVARFAVEDGELAELHRYGGPYADGGLGIVATGGAQWVAAAYIDASTRDNSLDAFGDYAGAGIVLFDGD